MNMLADENATAPIVDEQALNGEGFVITGEAIAVLVLVLVSLALRLLMLGGVPMTAEETRPALIAWRSMENAYADLQTTADSPILFWGQRLGFAGFGSNELGARVLTAIAGALLGLSPLLFRGLLGRSRAYIAALLLTFSPTLFAASRLSSGPVWALLFAILCLWALWRYWVVSAQLDNVNTDEGGAYAVGAVIALGALLLLSEPGGPVLALILAGALAIAFFLQVFNAPYEVDLPDDDYGRGLWAHFARFPWGSALGMAGLTIAGVSTGFLLFPGGLGMVGQMLGAFFDGITTPTDPRNPLFFPLAASLYYDLWLWVFGIVAIALLLSRYEALAVGGGIISRFGGVVGQMVRQTGVGFVERFFIAWVFVAVLASLIYQGGTAAHALWLLLPLVGLASYVLDEALNDNDTPTLWINDLLDEHNNPLVAARLGRWLLTVLMFALLIMVTIHFQVVARGILIVPGGTLNGVVERLGEDTFTNIFNSMIWLLISLLFIVVGYFLAASIWGNTTALRGGLLGLALFMILTNIGSGWRVAVSGADDPVELWHTSATYEDAATLRQTMTDLAFQQLKGGKGIPTAVMAEHDGVIAWLLRDFPAVRYISTEQEAFQEQVILLTEVPLLGQEPDFGGSYVGQSFVISRTWATSFLEGADFLAWWATQDTRFGRGPVTDQTAVLWVRQDVYDGNPLDPNTILP